MSDQDTFATQPEDLKKSIGLASETGVTANVKSFHCLEKGCQQNSSRVVEVIDSNGELVCLAPLKIGQLIARLLDQCDEIPE